MYKFPPPSRPHSNTHTQCITKKKQKTLYKIQNTKPPSRKKIWATDIKALSVIDSRKPEIEYIFFFMSVLCGVIYVTYEDFIQDIWGKD